MPILARGARPVLLALLLGTAVLTAMFVVLGATSGSPEAQQAGAALLLITAVLLAVQPDLIRFVAAQADRVPTAVVRRGATAAMIGASLAALVSYAVCTILLRSGPDAPGYEALELANRFATCTALPAAGLQVVLVLAGAGRVRRRLAALGALAAATTVPVLALVLLGGLLTGMHPEAQPVDLNSIALAILATGWELLPIPVAFAAAAALLPLAAHLAPAAGVPRD